jgi:hypothetical protein
MGMIAGLLGGGGGKGGGASATSGASGTINMGEDVWGAMPTATAVPTSGVSTNTLLIIGGAVVAVVLIAPLFRR